MVLLDTCAIIWMVQDAPFPGTARAAIRRAASHHSVWVSPVSACPRGARKNPQAAGTDARANLVAIRGHDAAGHHRPLDPTASIDDMVISDDHFGFSGQGLSTMQDEILEISATEFKAKCLGLFKDLEAHRYSKVVITRRGKAIAELTQPKREVPDLWGALKGRAMIPPGVDLTEPVLEEIPEAARDMPID